MQAHGEVWFRAALRIAVAEYHAKQAVSAISGEGSTADVEALKQRVQEAVTRTLSDMQGSEEDAGGMAPMSLQMAETT